MKSDSRIKLYEMKVKDVTATATFVSGMVKDVLCTHSGASMKSWLASNSDFLMIELDKDHVEVVEVIAQMTDLLSEMLVKDSHWAGAPVLNRLIDKATSVQATLEVDITALKGRLSQEDKRGTETHAIAS